MERFATAYGTRSTDILQGVHWLEDLGQYFGGGADDGLYEREVRYLTENEFAVTAADILWRRTKLGLKFSLAESEMLDAWLKSQTEE